MARVDQARVDQLPATVDASTELEIIRYAA
jgi:hypothetical protein